MAIDDTRIDEDYVSEQIQDLLDQQLENDDYNDDILIGVRQRDLDNALDMALAILRSGSRLFHPAGYGWVVENPIASNTAIQLLVSIGAADEDSVATISYGGQTVWEPNLGYYLLLKPHRDSKLCGQSNAVDLRMFKKKQRQRPCLASFVAADRK